MDLLKFIEHNLNSFSRSRRKKQAVLSVLNAPQFNKDVINIHRIDVNNVGDFYCAPHLYFDELKNKQLDIYDYKDSDKNVVNRWINKISENALIIGGGGLLNRSSFEKQMLLFQELNTKGKKTVIWGAGHNDKNKKNFGNISKYNVDTKRFGLVGVRDYSMKEQWVPCVSCMHSIFDNTTNETQELGIVYHKKTAKNKRLLKKYNGIPHTSNTTNLEDMISFIGASSTIVTDSYHAMYWAMLLGKKVVVVPNSSKFFDFKYQPVISTFENFVDDVNKAQAYSGLLEECREQNRKFATRVIDYLNL